MILYYVRHGAPSYDPDCLTKRGHFQAEETSKFLLKQNIEKFFSSDSTRAYQTALHTTEKYGKEIIQLHFLNENISWSHLSMPYKNKITWFYNVEEYQDFFSKNVDNEKWFEDKLFENLPVKKCFDETDEELDKLLLSINIKHDRKTKTYVSVGKTPKTIAIFAHGGMGTIVTRSLLDLNPMNFYNLFKEIRTCGIIKFEIDLENTHKIKLISYNEIYYDHDESDKVSNEI